MLAAAAESGEEFEHCVKRGFERFAAEPLYMSFDAQISFEPVMNAEDMQAGVCKAMEAA